MKTIETINEVRPALADVRSDGRSIGFVPTMGAMHEAHLELIRAARRECDVVVVSIFVNPTQFGLGEDYSQYPRPMDRDLDLCWAERVDLVFSPSVDQMYPDQRLTTVHVAGLTETLCGASRPGHFDGVTTVVAKLFNIIEPDIAYFGQKDAQQALVIRKMTKDLNIPVKIRVCPTVRDADGLALSSRNEYLSADDRKRALCLWQGLVEAQRMIESGQSSTGPILTRIRELIEAAGPVGIDYLSIVDPVTMRHVERIDRPVLIALAVKIGSTRLIDNILLDCDGRESNMDSLPN